MVNDMVTELCPAPAGMALKPTAPKARRNGGKVRKQHERQEQPYPVPSQPLRGG
ncbi:hypothetical protein STXM2123_2572 [Streptomyces sp. F-3]|nr:hypothetical protein STXM2123_2572 [Streptomyces sp. F-3]